MQKRLIFTVFVFGMLVSGGYAGTLQGRIYRASDQAPVRRLAVVASPQDAQRSFESHTDSEGQFVFEDLPPGRYSLSVGIASQGDMIGLGGQAVSDLEVTKHSITEVLMVLQAGMQTDSSSWVSAHREFGQTFVAQGSALTGVVIRAYGPEALVTASIHAEGPSGSQIGPARTLQQPICCEGFGRLNWSSQDLELAPGETYYLKLVSPTPWISGVGGQGASYPYGMAYFDGIPQPSTDLGLVMLYDEDLVTVYSSPDSSDTALVRTGGQSFIASTSDITLVGIRTDQGWGSPLFIRVSLHAGGPSGQQIGPSRAIRGGGWKFVSWSQGQVPLEPRKRYYLNIEKFGDGQLLLYRTAEMSTDSFAVWDGEPIYDQETVAIIKGTPPAPLVFMDSLPPTDIISQFQGESVGLVNPSFEEGLAGWGQSSTIAGAVVGAEHEVTPPDGEKMFGWTNELQGEGSRVIVYQQVETIPGRTYVFSGQIYTEAVGGRASDVKARLVVDVYGQPEVSPDYEDQLQSGQWYATDGEWVEGVLVFEARSARATIGFDFEQRFNLTSSKLYADQAQLQLLPQQINTPNGGTE